MANWDILKKAISDVIKTNGNQEITGASLQSTLLSIVSNVGANATFAGIATPAINPGTPDGPVFYIASEPGIYANFNNTVVTNEVVVLHWVDNVWSKLSTGLAAQSDITSIIQKINNVSQDMNSKIGVNYFDYSRTGYISSTGTYVSSLSTGAVTHPIRVSEGQKIKFRGGWLVNADISFVWGYANEALESPTKLVPSSFYVSTEIVIPQGVNYIMAWSLISKNPSLEIGDTITARLEEVEKNSLGKKDVISNNLFNKDTVTHGYYVDYNNGELFKNNMFDASDYIKVLPSTVYSQKYSQQLAFYDKNKVYISGIATLVNGNFTTPENARFVKICNQKTQTPTQQVNKGSSLLDYDKWGEGIPSLLVRAENVIGLNNATVTRITATRNAENYNSIRNIMNSISDASEYNKYEIFVPIGKWFECDIQGKEFVSIIGEDRERTILYCDGASSKVTPSDYTYAKYSDKPLSSIPQQYKHCIYAKHDIDIKNLTIEVNNAKYDIHLDYTDFKNIKIKNCHLKILNNVNYCVGIGIRGGQSIDIDNCIFERQASIGNGVVAHNWNNQKATSHVSINNCYFKNCSFITLDELGSEQDDEWFITNCYSNVDNPSLSWMVDSNSEGKTYWINPNTGTNEADPQKVPYCIKVNTLGTNVKSVILQKFNSTQVVARPDALNYMISNSNLIEV